ncbi:subtilisin-like protease [Musa troglodytarum]|uniref:Subtilisin-like protease n=1 Tax=Musa troglodytarum TaxID=320322 RepID=A0A9E7H2H5_9LILI|nr:subtilisin-like protease [Musa troglodytarum]
MALPRPFLSLLLCLCAASLLSARLADGSDELKVYIVHVKHPDDVAFSDAAQWSDWYSSLLQSAASTLAASRLVHSYHNVMTGFSAFLTEKEVEAMSKLDWFLQAYPSRAYRLHTTRTPTFLGLRRGKQGVWRSSNMGEGVIIGLLDSGITPGHPSFDDYGMPPPPAKWKGRCDLNASFCNNKLIGARSFVNYDGLVDADGHGTHTASTAAGAFVKRANIYGLARGLASGMAPRAHLAIYKVCLESCASDDILAGMDAAVGDGVDVLSISLGGDPVPFFVDAIALGGFNAISKGIFVSCSAGNSGPDHYTVSNDAPWLLTVGASTVDRSFRATVKLGDGQELDGESMYQPSNYKSKLLPLVYPGLITGNSDTALCMNGTLDSVDVRGKIVLCDRGTNMRVEKGQVVKKAGGAGMILVNDALNSYSTNADLHVLPASHLPYSDAAKIKVYINSTSAPTAAIIFKGTALRVPNSPALASFSSRGPSQITPGILKPDILGPGVNVLAAWNTQKFNMISGTSMSCPHLSGISALIKHAHPDWSPAAIKSAILTTARQKDNRQQPIVDEKHVPADLFAVGAGHVDPQRAIDPGLVYDLAPGDYIPYLCGLGIKDESVSAIVRKNVKCSSVKSITEGELNYPSITVTLPAIGSKWISYTRTVTNVGKPMTEYSAAVDVAKGVTARVRPAKLYFKEVNQKQSFTISFRRNGDGFGPAEGRLRWVSKEHVVRSPISIFME